MTSLKQLQESFQRGILAGDDTILSEVNDSTKERRDVLFGVYRNAYVARLAEIVAEDYEQTHAYLGDARFAKLVKDYIAAHPSDHQNARWFGRHLPAFIEGTEPFARHPELAELALLEKALNDAFDAADAAPLSIEHLAALAPDAWLGLVLEPRPTAIRLKFQTNAAKIWSALHDETTPPKSRRLPKPQAILVWTQEFMARFRPLESEEAMMWDEAAKGVRFGVLCEMVAIFAGEDDAELRLPISRTWSTRGCWRLRRARLRTIASRTGRERCRKQRITPPAQPIREQPHPFTRGRIDPPQAFGDLVEWPGEIDWPPRPVIYRPRIELEAGLAERTHRAGHMKGRGDQHPSFARPEIALPLEFSLEEHRILVSVPRLVFKNEPLWRDPHRGEQRSGPFRLAIGLVKDAGAATGEGNLRLGKSAREHDRLQHALAGLVQGGCMTR
jgi:hypothetical protein